jgi:hypothetical protein
MDGEHEPGCGHDDDGDEAVDHGLLACSLVRLATVASARILIANSYASRYRSEAKVKVSYMRQRRGHGRTAALA